MAAVAVTITGMLYDRIARTSQNVVLIGEAQLTDLGTGGGPIVPLPPGDRPPGRPDRPEFPGTPEHPIFLPPGKPPIDPDPVPPDLVVKPPPEGGGWGYVSAWGWGYFPGDGRGPKR